MKATAFVQSPTNPLLLAPVLVAGFILNPAGYIWLGVSLWQEARQTVMVQGAAGG